MTDIRERIARCDSLPTLPAAALRVLQMSDDVETDLAELSEMISKDAALSVKLLRAVNSPFYGVGQKVATVSQAVALLGTHSVKTVVLSFSMVSSLKSQKAGAFDYLTYWRRSIYSASAARLLASRFLPDKEEQCFVAGLLMDIGALILQSVAGETYDSIYEQSNNHQELVLREAAEFNITHAEVGAMIAQQWSLPDVLTIPIRSHHAPQEVEDAELKKIAQIIWLAGRCAEIFVSDRDSAEAISSVRASLRELYQQEEPISDRLLNTISQKTLELATLFDVRINETSYDEILATASQRLLEISIAQRDSSPRKSVSNKRRSTRTQRDGRIWVIACARGVLGKPVQMKLRDLSASGIGLTHRESVELESQFIIQLPQETGEMKSLLYTVKRCEKTAGMCNIGAELTSVLRPSAARGEIGATTKR